MTTRVPSRRASGPARPRSPLGPLALLALLALVLAPAATAQEQELDPRVFEIANELRCPTCVSESVGQSNSAIAREMRTLIQEQLETGADRAEVLVFFQERYGDWILLDPPKRGINLVVWLLPVAAALGGLTLLGVLLRRWRAAGEAPVDADPADVARVRAVLGSTDAGRSGEEDDEPWRS
jgi:cytochrome c-type biogenesis protein CcmH